MAVRIVTDSTSDLPAELVTEFGIEVVPVIVRFGQDTFRDGVDITQDEVYRRLADGEPATTSQPAPADFTAVYDSILSQNPDDLIISLHLSGKLSGTFNAAVAGRELSAEPSRIRVVDSNSISMGLGFGVLAAARLAAAKTEVEQIIHGARDAASATRVVAIFDTLKYVLKSGRLGAAKALVGGILNVKPILTLKDGVLWPSGIARTRARALETLVDIVRKTPQVEETAIVYSTDSEEAINLKNRLGEFIGAGKVKLSRLGPALGAHGGPGTLVMAVKNRLSPASA